MPTVPAHLRDTRYPIGYQQRRDERHRLGYSEAAQRLAQHRNTIRRWLSQYEREGLAGLLCLGRAGAPAGGGQLSEAMRQALGERLAEPSGFSSYQEVRLWLYDEFRV